MSSEREAATDLVDFYTVQAFEDAAMLVWVEQLNQRLQEGERRDPEPSRELTAIRTGLADFRALLSGRVLAIEFNLRLLRASLDEKPQVR